MLNVGDIIEIYSSTCYGQIKSKKGIRCRILGVLPSDHSNNKNNMVYYIIGSNTYNRFFDRNVSDMPKSEKQICSHLEKYKYYAYYSVKDFDNDFEFKVIYQSQTLFRVIQTIQNELI
jgi:hypothetical protein